MLELQRQQSRFVRWHEVGAVLRGTGGLGDQQLPGGAPEPYGFAFKRWDLAVENEQALKPLRPALRLRYEIDHGWGPTLLLASDVSVNPAPPEPTPRAGWAKLRGWVGSGSKVEPVEVM